MTHLDFELYLLVLGGELPAAALVHAAHDHLIDRCPACRTEWAAAGGPNGSSPRGGLPARDAGGGPPAPDRARGPGISVPAPAPRCHRSVFSAAARRLEAAARSVRLARRAAHRDLAALRALPRRQWPQRLEAARSRFRSRAFAELLLAEARRRLVADAAEAAELARLVPRVLHRLPAPATPDPADETWRRALAEAARGVAAAARASMT